MHYPMQDGKNCHHQGDSDASGWRSVPARALHHHAVQVEPSHYAGQKETWKNYCTVSLFYFFLLISYSASLVIYLAFDVLMEIWMPPLRIIKTFYTILLFSIEHSKISLSGRLSHVKNICHTVCSINKII